MMELKQKLHKKKFVRKTKKFERWKTNFSK